ncbi:MAG: hypothetical protein R3358_00805 [Woeseiaceae bacterium]|nr:hypothetical protein [Woeseiaceae bacterium]
MTHFEFLSVALSFVLGLAVTVLLTSLLTAFRARRETRLGWLPLTWAAYILVIQFDVWWEVYGVATMETWSAGAFVILLLLTLLLFAAGGLILPRGLRSYPTDLDAYFEQDGKWAVAVLGVFALTAIVANVMLFDEQPLGLMNLWNLGAIAITLTVVTAKRRGIQNAFTIVYGVWVAIYIWTFVPASY